MEVSLLSAISQTHKRYLKDDDGNVYWPVAAWDAIIGLDGHLSDWTTTNSQFVFDQIKQYIPTVAGKSAYEVAVANGFKGTEVEWLASLKPPDINKSLKLQSSNGTVFILSVDDDGKLITSKEEDSSGN